LIEAYYDLTLMKFVPLIFICLVIHRSLVFSNFAPHSDLASLVVYMSTKTYGVNKQRMPK